MQKTKFKLSKMPERPKPTVQVEEQVLVQQELRKQAQQSKTQNQQFGSGQSSKQ